MRQKLLEPELTIKPFLRYVGGKRWFVNKFENHLPRTINNYYEPFIGSGSIFFYLKNNNKIKGHSYLNDLNHDLINSFLQVKEFPNEIYNDLSEMKNSKSEYYQVRDLIPASDLNKAIRYMYLNRTCFGGIYRVNKNGEFNVPYGNRQYKEMVDYKNLMKCSHLLKNEVHLTSNCFSKIEYDIKQNDFICLDPPYLCNDTKFNRYNSAKFSSKDSNFLEELIRKIISQNARFLLFIGNDVDFAERLKDCGDKILLNRQNNLSKASGFNEKIEFIIKNY